MLVKYGEEVHDWSRYIAYKCSVCGYEGQMRNDHWRKGIGCSACAGKSIHHGYNDVASQRPDLLPFFENPKDAESITVGSHKIVSLRCPDCGLLIRRKMIELSRRGLHCPVCTDGFSYPSRFVAATLKSLFVEYETEKTFPWGGKYRYDFYLPKEKILIEVQGLQHYRKTGFSKDFSATASRDAQKKGLAIYNGYAFVAIDGRESSFDFMKQSCISALCSSLDFSSINWSLVKEQCDVRIGKQILDAWNAGERSTRLIAEKLRISPSTALVYLKRYAEIGMCDYDVKQAMMQTQTCATNSRKKKTKCITTGDVFDSAVEAADAYGLSRKALAECLRGASKTCGRDSQGHRLYWQYI